MVAPPIAISCPLCLGERLCTRVHGPDETGGPDRGERALSTSDYTGNGRKDFADVVRLFNDL
jgi:hypothetical protein